MATRDARWAIGDGRIAIGEWRSAMAYSGLVPGARFFHVGSAVFRYRRSSLANRPSLMDADLLRIPVGPGSMHVERYGHGGAPILLVHGFGTCSFLWREVGPVLAMANRTAFAVDLFGYGESDRPFDAQ